MFDLLLRGEGGEEGSLSQAIWPGQQDPEKVQADPEKGMPHSAQLLRAQIVVKDFCGT